MLLLVSGLIAIANGLSTPTLNGLASQMIDRGWQGRALGIMQSAGSMGRLIGPLLAGWLLTFDLNRPIAEYARTPLLAGGGILFIAFVLALTVRKPAEDKMPPEITLEADA
jgi:MFS family permease